MNGDAVQSGRFYLVARSAALVMACLCFISGLQAQSTTESDGPRTKDVRLSSGTVTLTIGLVYDITPYTGQTIRGSFVNANAQNVKLAVSRSADGERTDIVYLAVRNIRLIDERRELDLKVRDQIPDDVLDPYESLRREVEELSAAGNTPENPVATEDAIVTPAPTAIVTIPPPSAGSMNFGEVDPAIAARVSEIMAKVMNPEAPNLDPTQLAAVEAANLQARDSLKLLGPGVTPVLARQVASAEPHKLELLSVVLVEMGEGRALGGLRAEYAAQNRVPQSELMMTIGASKMPGSVEWLVSIAGNSQIAEDSRRLACASLLQADISAEVAEVARDIIATSNGTSLLARTALSLLVMHSTDPSADLIDLLESNDQDLMPYIVNELVNSTTPDLDATLLVVAERTGMSIQEAIAEVLMRRISTNSSDEVLIWLVTFLAETRDTQVLAAGVNNLIRASLPGRDRGIDYDTLVLECFADEEEVELLQTGLRALSVLGESASNEVCDALLEVWRSVSDYDAATKLRYKPFLDPIPDVLRKMTGKAMNTPEAFELWITER